MCVRDMPAIYLDHYMLTGYFVWYPALKHSKLKLICYHQDLIKRYLESLGIHVYARTFSKLVSVESMQSGLPKKGAWEKEASMKYIWPNFFYENVRE